MSPIKQELLTQNFSEKIQIIQASVAENPSDLAAKINLAVAFEEEGHYERAIEVYQQIIGQDREGTFAESSALAIAEIKENFLGETENGAIEETETREGTERLLKEEKETANLWQKVANLPIGVKQFIALFSSSLISILAIVVASRAITFFFGRSQLQAHALSELAESVIDYKLRLDGIELLFREVTNNMAIINASREYRNTGAISPQLQETVKRILKSEVSLKQIEYATLVGLDSRIIVNANANRSGEIFNPNNLVQKILAFPRQFQTNAIIPWEEVLKEQPPLPLSAKGQDVLMTFSFSPVRDPQTQEVIGLLIAGEVINGKTSFMKDTFEGRLGEYGAVYMFNQGQFQPVTSFLQTQKDGKGREDKEDEKVQSNVPLPSVSLLEQAEEGVGGDLVERMKIQNQWYTLAVKSLPDYQGNRIAFIVRGVPELGFEQLLDDSLRLQLGIGGLTLVVAAILGIILARALTRPIERLQLSAQKISSGERHVRAEVTSQDEVGQLALSFNEMAASMEAYTQNLENIARQREEEAEFQKQQKENLQKNVINLLLDIERASKGNLTVQTEVISGEVGSIADAFNATIKNLQGLVKQVIEATNQVHESALANGQSVTHLAKDAYAQAQAIQLVSSSIDQMAQSIQKVSESARDAAHIAHQSRLAAREGEETMDKTVNSIYQIRHSVAGSSKKAKRLADSSQEISKIVSIIADISEKTNLLAFNASIEAARAGENGQGFRVVADEVRRLAEQVTFSAQEIEQLVITIQGETAEMMQMMEQSTAQVVTGTTLVQKSKETLQKLAQISQEIDGLLESISARTASQKLTSQQVTEKMQEVAVITKETASESKSVSESLKQLVTVAVELKQSASRFQVD